MRNYFGENLRKLRKLTGLTQGNLAQELNKFALNCGLVKEEQETFGKGKKKICNLENGKQEPSLTDINIVSKYFNLSPTELINEDNSKKIEFLKNVSFNIETESSIFPIFTIKENDPLFNDAYEQHINILKQQEINEERLKKCLTSYIISWEKNFQRKEAIANYLSLLLVNCLFNIGKIYINNKSIKFNDVNDVFGKDIEPYILKNKENYLKNSYIEPYIDILQENGFSEFVEFFTALSYMVGFVGNADSFYRNKEFGFVYLYSLVVKENRYAMLYYLTTTKVYGYEEQEDMSIEEVDEFCNILIEELKQEGVLFLL